MRRQREGHKVYSAALGQVHFFIKGLYGQRAHGLALAIDVGYVFMECTTLLRYGLQRKVIQLSGVGLEVDPTARLQQLLVGVQEAGVGEAVFFLSFFKEGIGEDDPYLRHLAGCKVLRDLVDLRTQEGDIGKPFLQRGLSAGIDTVALDVYTYEIPVAVFAAQTHAILALAARQLQGDGVLVLKELMPLALHPLRELQYIIICFYGPEFDQLLMTHNRGRKIQTLGDKNQIRITIHK